jgi:hypothetical protein
VRVSEEERADINRAAAHDAETVGTWARRKLLELARAKAKRRARARRAIADARAPFTAQVKR